MGFALLSQILVLTLAEPSAEPAAAGVLPPHADTRVTSPAPAKASPTLRGVPAREASRALASGDPDASCAMQDGMNIGTMTPLETDEDVVTFYAYGLPDPASYNGSYPTVSGDSMIFIHRDSATGARSLVIIHDRPNDGSGGQVHMEVAGLGTAASVAVEDDPGENLAAGLDGLGNASFDWQWLPCCTDGVAVADVDWDSGCVSVDADFAVGIDTWSFVDGETLDRVPLDPTAPLQICPGDCNACPTAVAGPPQTVECSGDGEAAVTLDGSASTDPDGDPLDHDWSIDGGAQTASGEIVEVALGLGDHDVALTVSDGVCEDADATLATVQDTLAPSIDRCPADATVTLDPDACRANLAQIAHGSDVCEGPMSDSHLFAFDAPGAQTHEYELVDSSGHRATCQQTVTALDETAPSITCPADETLVLDAATCTASLMATATGTDACDGPMSAAHRFDFAAPGSQTHTYVLTDVSDNSSSCGQTVSAVDRTPPVVVCPPDRSIVLSADTCQASVIDEAVGFDSCDGAVSESHLFRFGAPGAESWTYVVSDASGNTSSCTQTVTAVDVTPPVYTPGPTVALWAPNHKYTTSTLQRCGSAGDACDGALDLDGGDAIITSLLSSEPEDVNAGGDGHTHEDAVILDGHTVALRGERQGRGSGRAYAIGMDIRDRSANVLGAECRVVVEHDQGSNP